MIWMGVDGEKMKEDIAKDFEALPLYTVSTD